MCFERSGLCANCFIDENEGNPPKSTITVDTEKDLELHLRYGVGFLRKVRVFVRYKDGETVLGSMRAVETGRGLSSDGMRSERHFGERFVPLKVDYESDDVKRAEKTFRELMNSIATAGESLDVARAEHAKRMERAYSLGLSRENPFLD